MKTYELIKHEYEFRIVHRGREYILREEYIPGTNTQFRIDFRTVQPRELKFTEPLKIWNGGLYPLQKLKLAELKREGFEIIAIFESGCGDFVKTFAPRAGFSDYHSTYRYSGHLQVRTNEEGELYVNNIDYITNCFNKEIEITLSKAKKEYVEWIKQTDSLINRWKASLV